MPVFDFNSAPEDKKEVQCTYTTFCSNEDHATPECPIPVSYTHLDPEDFTGTGFS